MSIVFFKQKILNCRFCGKQTGIYEYPVESEIAPDKSEADLDVSDVRCTACESEHGSFKSMAEEFERTFHYKIGYEEFKKHIDACGYKVKNFTPSLARMSAKCVAKIEAGKLTVTEAKKIFTDEMKKL